ncbi:1870_t:CDS:1, partial [Dentiscutata heterogama]
SEIHYSFFINEQIEYCNNTVQFQTIKIIDNTTCVFDNAINDPGSYSCTKENNTDLLQISTKRPCSIQCAYFWKFSQNSKTVVHAVYECAKPNNQTNITVKYLDGIPTIRTVFINVPPVPENPHMYFLQYFGDDCLIYSPMFGSSSCSYVPEKEIYNLTLSDYENSYNFSIPMNSTSTDTLTVHNGLPKVYNFRYKLVCRDLLVSIYIIENSCFATTFRDYNFSTYDFNIDLSSRFSRERCTSHGHVFLTACIPHEYFTFSFDPNNPDNITSDNDNINNIVFLRPFPDINSYTSTEIAISCLFGVNVVNYQLMVPRYNISECIDSYLEERSMDSTAFYSQLEIGQPPSYPCSDVLDAAKILCEAYTNYVNNFLNYYYGLMNAIAEVGNIFTGMVIDLTANPDQNAKRDKLNDNSWVEIIISLVGLPSGGGQAILGAKTYLGLFPLLETIATMIFSFWHKENSGPSHDPRLLPISFYEFADILLSFEDNSTEIFRKSLKITDNMVDRNHSLLINQTLEELVNFQNVNNSEEIRRTYVTELKPKLARLVLKANDVKICNNYQNYLNDFCVVSSCNGMRGCHFPPIFCHNRPGYLDYGNFITRWGSNVSNNVRDNHAQPSDVICLLSNLNFQCPQVEKIEYYGVSLFDLCNTTDADDPLGLSSVECHNDDFYCHDGNNACFGT